MTRAEAPHTIYLLASGVRVPSVTTYLGILGKPAIIQWAWELGTQGLDYRKVRDQAGDIGDVTHYYALCKVRQVDPEWTDAEKAELAKATEPLSKFDKWYDEHEVVPYVTEEPMVSEKYHFGGTPDFYGLVDGVKTLVDFKTSKHIYNENLYQVAAYKKLLEEHKHKVDAVSILRLGKKTGEGFEYKAVTNLEDAWKIFLATQQIYELGKGVKCK